VKDYVAAQIIGYIADVVDVYFWNDEKLTRVNGPNCHKRHYLFIFVNHARVSSPMNNFAEDTLRWCIHNQFFSITHIILDNRLSLLSYESLVFVDCRPAVLPRCRYQRFLFGLQ